MSTQTRVMADCQVVIIDDDPELCYMLSELLRTDGYVTATFQSGEQGLKALRNSLPQLVILDVTCRALFEMKSRGCTPAGRKWLIPPGKRAPCAGNLLHV